MAAGVLEVHRRVTEGRRRRVGGRRDSGGGARGDSGGGARRWSSTSGRSALVITPSSLTPQEVSVVSSGSGARLFAAVECSAVCEIVC